MKDLKTLYSLVLAIVLMLGLTVPTMAADTDFIDVPADADYAQAVA